MGLVLPLRILSYNIRLEFPSTNRTARCSSQYFSALQKKLFLAESTGFLRFRVYHEFVASLAGRKVLGDFKSDECALLHESYRFFFHTTHHCSKRHALTCLDRYHRQ